MQASQDDSELIAAAVMCGGDPGFCNDLVLSVDVLVLCLICEYDWLEYVQ